jgi:DNA-binding response OmpR family regulator
MGEIVFEPEDGWHLTVVLVQLMSQFNGFDVLHRAVHLDETDVVVIMLTQKIKLSFMIAALCRVR